MEVKVSMSYLDDEKYSVKNSSDNELIIPEYIIDLKNKSKKTIEVFENLVNLQNLSNSPIDEDVSNSKQIVIKKNKKKPFKKKYKKKSK